MSRIGRRPIEVPSGVTVDVSPGGSVTVTGPLGTLEQQVSTRMQITQEDGVITVARPSDRGPDRALHGLTRSLVANMVEGVTKGFEKHLEIQGVGYRAQLKGPDLELAVGYSHPVVVTPRAGISFDVPVPTQVIVQRLGQAGRRTDRCRDSQGAPAGAVQGQGDPLPGRARPQKGREASSMSSLSTREARLRRHRRVRGKVSGSAERPRLVVFRSNRGVFAQLVDDEAGTTLASASWLQHRDLTGTKTEQAHAVGLSLAAAARKAGIKRCVFDRAGYLYHGRVKALAEGAREGGLVF